MDTQTGNRVIELFMHPERRAKDGWIFYDDTHGTRFHESVLSYHKSWDALMPVVEKIQKLGYVFIIGDAMRVDIYGNNYDWHNGHTSDTTLDCVWHGCTQFIQWYNTHITD